MALAGSEDIAIHPRQLLSWRDSKERLSRTADAYSTRSFTDCKAAHLAAGFLKTSSRYVLWGYGKTGRALRRALARHGRTPSHIVELHPGRIDKIFPGLPAFFGKPGSKNNEIFRKWGIKLRKNEEMVEEYLRRARALVEGELGLVLPDVSAQAA